MTHILSVTEVNPASRPPRIKGVEAQGTPGVLVAAETIKSQIKEIQDMLLAKIGTNAGAIGQQNRIKANRDDVAFETMALKIK